MSFHTIVFDFDGVLADSVDVKTRAFAALYAEHGAEVVSEVVAYHLAHGGLSRFEKFRHFQEHLLRRPPLTAGEEDDLGNRFRTAVFEAVVAAPWVAGAREALERLAAEMPLFVASGTPDGELREIIAGRGMERFFVSVHGSPTGKGEILRTLAARHGFAPGRMLMVGDAATDLAGARAAGTAFLGRVPAGEPNPFPAGVPVVAELWPLAERPLHALPGVVVPP
jgi:phosphoglycolate phosphatase-like HAD superfamily hydrolase